MIEINIVDKVTGEVVETMRAISMAESRRIVGGIEINLNHDEYKVVTKEVEK
jgi:hypothetical protein